MAGLWGCRKVRKNLDSTPMSSMVFPWALDVLHHTMSIQHQSTSPRLWEMGFAKRLFSIHLLLSVLRIRSGFILKRVDMLGGSSAWLELVPLCAVCGFSISLWSISIIYLWIIDFVTTRAQVPFYGAAQLAFTEASAIVRNWRIETPVLDKIVVEAKRNLNALDTRGVSL